MAALSVYLDASMLVSFIVNDALTVRAERVLGGLSASALVSDFVVAEVASAIGRRVRVGRLSVNDARATFVDLDSWLARAAQRVEITPHDVSTASAYIRRLDLNLRAPTQST